MTKAIRREILTFDRSISSRAHPSPVRADGSSSATITPPLQVLDELDDEVAFALPTSSDQTSPSAPRSFKFITKSSVSSFSVLMILREGVDGAVSLSSVLSVEEEFIFFAVVSSSFELVVAASA